MAYRFQGQFVPVYANAFLEKRSGLSGGARERLGGGPTESSGRGHDLRRASGDKNKSILKSQQRFRF